MQSICVFCGSSPGRHPGYLKLARELGEMLARRKLTVIYGGGRVGLMGAVADAALGAGGRVIGVIPQLLIDKEVGHAGLSELRIVNTMAQRKLLMGDLADAFITLPGGIGTMDELFEAWTWTQLGLHAKPCGLLNHEGYYDPLIQFVDRAVQEGFLRPPSRAQLLVDTDMTRLVERLIAATADVSLLNP
jgi:uncharacterized protein (TIGR00730 family)